MVRRSSHAVVQKAARSSASAQNASANPHPGPRKRFPRHRILRGHSAFSRVLNDGRTLIHPPIRLFFRTTQGSGPGVRVGFAVSRSLRSAVRRNRARRLMKEAYRLHQDIWQKPGQESEAVWMYFGKTRDIPAFETIERAVVRLMEEAQALRV